MVAAHSFHRVSVEDALDAALILLDICKDARIREFVDELGVDHEYEQAIREWYAALQQETLH